MSHARSHIHIPQNLGDKLADVVATGMGSWKFIIIQTVIVASWLLYNKLSEKAFDPYPFILLNLLFSTQAAYAAPIIMKSQNRQASKDRTRDDIEAVEVDEIRSVTKAIHDLLQKLDTMNEQQLQILNQQNEILDMLKPKSRKQSV